eukprot:SAG11_NODE_3004_length_2774_cov_1.712897_1_plen_89_part_10
MQRSRNSASPSLYKKPHRRTLSGHVGWLHRAVAAAIKVADMAPEGSVILTMLPDTGERYLSTPLFAESASRNLPVYHRCHVLRASKLLR